MSVITRSWLSFAAIGAGVIHLALVITSPLAIGIPLVVVGVAELAWGSLILLKNRLLVPRLARGGAIIPLLLWGLVTVVSALIAAPGIVSSLRFVPLGITGIFELFLTVVLSVIIRRQSRETEPVQPARPVGAVKYLTAVIAAGLLVGALTTPALAATQAGSVAKEHGGTMGGMMTMNVP